MKNNANTTINNAMNTEYIANNPTNHEQVRKELCCRYSRAFQMVCENIDNTVSDIRANNIKNGVIDIVITNNDYRTITIDVYDNGTGIKNFDGAISLGDVSTAQTAGNAHSFGLKAQSYLAIDDTFILESTYNGEGRRAVGKLLPNHKVTFYPNGIPGLEHGTHVSYELPFAFLQAENRRAGEKSGAGHINNFHDLVDCLSETLMLYYGDQMTEYGYTITMTALDGEDDTTPAKTLKPLNPVLTVLSKKTTKGGKVQTEYADRDFTMPACNGDGVIKGNAKLVCIEKAADSILHYWSRAQVSSGIYIKLHQRLIHKEAQLRKDVAKHPSANNLAMIVNLDVDYADQAPRTEVSKTSFVESIERDALLDEIYKIFPDLLEFVNECEDILNETYFTKMWADDLRNQANPHSVELFPRVPGKSGQANDLIDHTTSAYYEIKLGDAGVAGVRQIESYVRSYLYAGVGMPFKRVVLVSECLNRKAQQALDEANFFLKHFNVKIEHAYLHKEAGNTWEKFNELRIARHNQNA